MTVHLPQPRISRRPRTARGRRRAAAQVAQRSALELPSPRERAAGGPEDRALYHCHCGFIFEAAVTTSVGCPHCGTAQAW